MFPFFVGLAGEIGFAIGVAGPRSHVSVLNPASFHNSFGAILFFELGFPESLLKLAEDFDFFRSRIFEAVGQRSEQIILLIG